MKIAYAVLGILELIGIVALWVGLFVLGEIADRKLRKISSNRLRRKKGLPPLP